LKAEVRRGPIGGRPDLCNRPDANVCDLGSARLLLSSRERGPGYRNGDDPLAAIRGQWQRRARSLSPWVIRAPRQAARLLGHRSRRRPGLTACRPRRLSRP